MNYSDSERIAGIIEQNGFKQALSAKEADLAIVNVCSVRQSAVDRAQNKIKTIKKENKKLKILITGCVLQKDKKTFEKLGNKLFPINNLQDLPKLLKEMGFDLILQKEFRARHYLQIAPKYESKISVSVPIMTGCNNFCSYCVVPYTRGQEISRPAENIIKEIKDATQQGAKEIWLLGQNVNSYHSKNSDSGAKIKKEIKFPDLLKMANNIKGNFWIRFASSHPKDLSKEMIETFAKCKKVAPYFNLPIQSGNNAILALMNRPYNVGQYEKLIQKIRQSFQKYRQGLEKKIAISTDIIVGFPGETRRQFEDSKKILKKISFVNVFISRFSPRPLTPASKMKDNVSDFEKKQREKELTEIIKKTSLEFNKQFLGKSIEVLVLEKKKNYYIGTSRHHQKTKIFFNKSADKDTKEAWPPCLIGKFIKIKIIKVTAYGLEARIK